MQKVERLSSFEKSSIKVREMAGLENCFPHKHEDLSVYPQDSHKEIQQTHVSVVPVLGRRRQEDSGGFLAT